MMGRKSVSSCRRRGEEGHGAESGPYLSERQWGTVREDCSDNGDAWNYFTHDRRAPAPTLR